jgi:hypothetical protein
MDFLPGADVLTNFSPMRNNSTQLRLMSTRWGDFLANLLDSIRKLPVI